MEKSQIERFKVQHIPSLLKATYKAWNGDNPWQLSASVAYYAVLSLPALLVIIVNIVGAIWGVEIVQGHMTEQFSDLIGPDTAEAIKEMITDTMKPEKSFLTTLIGIGTLIFGATGVFYQLQNTLNQIWGIQIDPKSGFKKIIFDRIRGFGFILIMGFLLLISFVLTTGINILNERLLRAFPDLLVYLAYILDTCISLSIITLLFAAMFRYLPDVKIQWRAVWIGALITSLLFFLGKYLLSVYFLISNPGTTYGAAGSIILILLWVSYSCLILFFGAKFTFIYAKRYGYGITPSEYAVRVKKTTKILDKKENT